jgi:hypothetical protein
VLLLSVVSVDTRAVDFAGAEIGLNDGDAIWRIGAAADWDWFPNLMESGRWTLAAQLELSASYWDGDAGRTGTSSLAEAGFGPALRLSRAPQAGGVAPFFEAGTGLHVMSSDEIQDLDFDLAFAIGSHIGLGLRFGERAQYELGYRYYHLSNADIGDTNPGINFHVVRFVYHF